MRTPEIHTLICGGRVVDGTGNPWQYADVALSGDRIAGVLPPGRVNAENFREVVDASGMVVCPGFIDIQSHSIIPLMTDARCLSKIAQGVTTEIMGEAWTPAPFGGKIERPLPPDFFGNRAARHMSHRKSQERRCHLVDQGRVGVRIPTPKRVDYGPVLRAVGAAVFSHAGRLSARGFEPERAS